jgi:hypothetical protein
MCRPLVPPKKREVAMDSKSIAGVVGVGLLLCSCVTSVAAECEFGLLCDKTVRMLFSPVRVCFNGSCPDNTDLTASAAYLATDGTVLTHFGSWWGIPGVTYDTFVCRSVSNKFVSRSCYGSSCKPDAVDEVLNSIQMIDSCSVAGSGDNLTITLLKRAPLRK